MDYQTTDPFKGNPYGVNGFDPGGTSVPPGKPDKTDLYIVLSEFFLDTRDVWTHIHSVGCSFPFIVRFK